MRMLILLLAVLASTNITAEEGTEHQGEVRLPLGIYTRMIEQTQEDQRPIPAPYAIGRSELKVQVVERTNISAAEINATIIVEKFDATWTLIPLLASGTPLTQALIDGEPIQLVQGPHGLSWNTNRTGKATVQLSYHIDARQSDAGFMLPIPVTQAAATELTITLPRDGLDVAVVPAANQRTVEQGGMTVIKANIPTTSSIMISWTSPTQRNYAKSRATYQGTVKDDALALQATFEVELFTNEEVTLPLMPTKVTLRDLRVDGNSATVLKEGNEFATVLQGKGRHIVTLAFDLPVTTRGGLPQVNIPIPKVPVSKFELSLPGKQALKVTPLANVRSTFSDDLTNATVFVPMSDSVKFSWTEALPENLRDEVRANASLYHIIFAEEGVLRGRAMVAYEITHGETNQLALEIPAAAQVNRISSPERAVSDWATSLSDNGELKKISVFLNRVVKGDLLLDIDYEVLLATEEQAATPLSVPAFAAVDVHRQRGMIALLAGRELMLKPVKEERVSRVGENQLPSFVRNELKANVAHTYKYIDRSPSLLVKTQVPERRQGKFDAQIDTLISIGEVTMKGSATIEIDVKSGAISDLSLKLPTNINVLSVSGPSLRKHDIKQFDDAQHIEIEFTQEMEGQFRLDVNYEQIMSDTIAEAIVPTVAVADAEVEHGRIAVEALTAVEVRATTTDQLSSLEINELPKQLVLKTTNPILLGYKYVHTHPPYKLGLKITRHKEINVQVAAIERADYKTLFTRDGLAVTTARFLVRNSRRQFLRLELPSESEIWSVFSNGKPEKPAHADGESNPGDSILIKMINSVVGFPVEVVYATPVQKMDFQGVLSSRLPRPDMIVTRSHWDVFLPAGPNYHKPDTAMDIVIAGRWANPRELTQQSRGAADGQGNPQIVGQPLRITVPTQGIQFAFEKLYANQAPSEAEFAIRYISQEGTRIGAVLSVVGVIFVWLGIGAIGIARLHWPRSVAVGSLVSGVVLLLVAIGYLKASYVLASALTLLLALLLAVGFGVNRLRAWLEKRHVESASTG